MNIKNILFNSFYIEKKIEDKAVINYKMPKYSKMEPKLNQKLGFKHLRDFLHIFVDLDSDNDGFLTYEDFYYKYYHILNKKDIESFFTRFGKTANDNGMIFSLRITSIRIHT